MALNFNIPLPGAPEDAMVKGWSAGNEFFKTMMAPKLKREELAQQMKIHQDSMKMQQAAAGRASAAREDAHKLFQLKYKQAEMETDPVKKLAYINQLVDGLGGDEAVPTEEPQQQPEMNLMDMIKNGGLANQGLQQGQGALMMAPPKEQVMQGLGGQPKQNALGIDPAQLKKDVIKAAIYKALGVKAPNEGQQYHGAIRSAIELEKLRKEKGENSPEFIAAKADYDAEKGRKEDLAALRARTRAGLKPGETQFYDPQTGEPIGKEIPLTATERAAEQGNILFNEFMPYVVNGGSLFSGEGSITRLDNAAANYKTDPKAKKAFDDFLLADKILAATVVNEAATLKAGKQNRTYAMLKESLQSSDIPRIVKKLIKEYKIPASAMQQAGMRYQQILSDARKKAAKLTPATQKLYYDPEKQAQNEEAMAEGNLTPKETVRMIYKGEEYNIPADMVAEAEKEGYKRG